MTNPTGNQAHSPSTTLISQFDQWRITGLTYGKKFIRLVCIDHSSPHHLGTLQIRLVADVPFAQQIWFAENYTAKVIPEQILDSLKIVNVSSEFVNAVAAEAVKMKLISPAESTANNNNNSSNSSNNSGNRGSVGGEIRRAGMRRPVKRNKPGVKPETLPFLFLCSETQGLLQIKKAKFVEFFTKLESPLHISPSTLGFFESVFEGKARRKAEGSKASEKNKEVKPIGDVDLVEELGPTEETKPDRLSESTENLKTCKHPDDIFDDDTKNIWALHFSGWSVEQFSISVLFRVFNTHATLPPHQIEEYLSRPKFGSRRTNRLNRIWFQVSPECLLPPVEDVYQISMKEYRTKESGESVTRHCDHCSYHYHDTKAIPNPKKCKLNLISKSQSTFNYFADFLLQSLMNEICDGLSTKVISSVIKYHLPLFHEQISNFLSSCGKSMDSVFESDFEADFSNYLTRQRPLRSNPRPIEFKFPQKIKLALIDYKQMLFHFRRWNTLDDKYNEDVFKYVESKGLESEDLQVNEKLVHDICSMFPLKRVLRHVLFKSSFFMRIAALQAVGRKNPLEYRDRDKTDFEYLYSEAIKKCNIGFDVTRVDILLREEEVLKKKCTIEDIERLLEVHMDEVEDQPGKYNVYTCGAKYTVRIMVSDVMICGLDNNSRAVYKKSVKNRASAGAFVSSNYPTCPYFTEGGRDTGDLDWLKGDGIEMLENEKIWCFKTKYEPIKTVDDFAKGSVLKPSSNASNDESDLHPFVMEKQIINTESTEEKMQEDHGLEKTDNAEKKFDTPKLDNNKVNENTMKISDKEADCVIKINGIEELNNAEGAATFNDGKTDCDNEEAASTHKTDDASKIDYHEEANNENNVIFEYTGETELANSINELVSVQLNLDEIGDNKEADGFKEEEKLKHIDDLAVAQDSSPVAFQVAGRDSETLDSSDTEIKNSSSSQSSQILVTSADYQTHSNLESHFIETNESRKNELKFFDSINNFELTGLDLACDNVGLEDVADVQLSILGSSLIDRLNQGLPNEDDSSDSGSISTSENSFDTQESYEDPYLKMISLDGVKVKSTQNVDSKV